MAKTLILSLKTWQNNNNRLRILQQKQMMIFEIDFMMNNKISHIHKNILNRIFLKT